MKVTILFSILFSSVLASAATPVSITKFANKAPDTGCRHDWVWWHDYLGSGFQEMLANELVSSGKVELLEREVIQDIYDGEHNLVNSEEDTSLKRGKFKKARFTIAGAVTEFEYCADRSGARVNVGAIASLLGASGVPSVGVGFGKATAKLAIDVRIIDTETGRVIKTVRSEGSAEDSRFSLDTQYGDYATREKTPMGRAVRDAIQKASAQIVSSL